MTNCFLNNPRPIFCPFVNLNCTQNQVVNPTLPGNFAYLVQVPGEVGAGENFDLGVQSFSGNNFIPNGMGGITLQAGSYEVTYSASATIPASGSVSIGLTLDGGVVAGSTVVTFGFASLFIKPL